MPLSRGWTGCVVVSLRVLDLLRDFLTGKQPSKHMSSTNLISRQSHSTFTRNKTLLIFGQTLEFPCFISWMQYGLPSKTSGRPARTDWSLLWTLLASLQVQADVTLLFLTTLCRDFCSHRGTNFGSENCTRAQSSFYWSSHELKDLGCRQPFFRRLRPTHSRRHTEAL